MLQTRNAKRTAQAAIRIAVDLADEKLITKEEAVWRVQPEHVDFYLHPQFDISEKKYAASRGDQIAKGLNVSPGAAVGQITFDADTAEKWAKEDKKAVIMVRPETTPNDVHGMLAAKGILTSRGGRTSPRRARRPPVRHSGRGRRGDDGCGRRYAGSLSWRARYINEGDWVSLDGTTGEVFSGKIKTADPTFDEPYLLKLLGWADDIRKLGVWANADYPRDARRARTFGAEGIGLCRTEHMFFETERLPDRPEDDPGQDRVEERKAALDKILALPAQRF